MFVVVELQGHQYIVSKGTEIHVDNMSLKDGETFTHDEVLCVFDEKEATVGKPFVDKAQVVFRVAGSGKGEKIHVTKFKRKNRYEKRQGFRRHYTALVVDEINV